MSEKNDNDSHYEELSGDAGLKRIYQLIKGIHIAMLTSVAKDGTMGSRPMAVQNTPFNETLWFLTRSTSEKIGEVQQDDRVRAEAPVETRPGVVRGNESGRHPTRAAEHEGRS